MSKPKITAESLYAFWYYDLYPYLIGGKVDKAATTDAPHLQGRLFVTSHQGWVKPTFTLPGIDGAILVGRLERLREQDAERQRAARAESVDALNATLASHGVSFAFNYKSTLPTKIEDGKPA